MGRTEDDVMQNSMLNHPDRGDIKLAVFLEPRITPRNPEVTAGSITAETNYLCDNYFNHPGYFSIDGKPVIFIYVTRAMNDADLTLLISTIRTAASNKGIGDVYIVGDEVWKDNIDSKTARVNQMDAITNYDVYGNLGKARFVTDTILDTWQANNNLWKSLSDSLGKQFIPAVSPGFNDKAVREGNQPSSRKLNNEDNAFGTLFSGMLNRITDDMNMLMVTSFNEWHEDTQIEPVSVAPPTNLDDGAGYYTDGLYYSGYGMLYLDILTRCPTVPCPLGKECQLPPCNTCGQCSTEADCATAGCTWSGGVPACAQGGTCNTCDNQDDVSRQLVRMLI